MQSSSKATTTTIYGNAHSDGFGRSLALVTLLFVLGGVGLAKVGAVALFAAVPVLVVLVALMARRLAKWDVTSEVPVKDEKPVDVKVTVFPMPAPSATAAVWFPSTVGEALPASVSKPKSPVETNTQVAA